MSLFAHFFAIKISRFHFCTRLLLAAALVAFVSPIFAQDDSENNASAERISFENVDAQTTRIFVDDQFFADYRADLNGTPIIWPICAPNGALASRAWPAIDSIDVDAEPDPTMKTIYQNAKISERGGAKDHPHHRSLWFNHGDVAGGDFWGLSPSTIRETDRSVATVDEGAVRIQTKNKWFNGKLERDVCEDVRTVEFGVLSKEKPVRYIDFSIEITALEDSVVFGDTKEGSFGYRMPSPTALTAKKTNPNWGGRILDSNGNENDDAWGKRSVWVNYSGPAAQFLENEALARELAKSDAAVDFPLTTIGVAVIDSPTSWAYPSWRHVRDYGLFATNPFGQHDFEPFAPDANGAKKLNRGEKLTFRYRVLIHNGDLTPDELNAVAEDFAKIAK